MFILDQTRNKVNIIKLVDAPQIEISASFIRKAIREKKDVSWFLPKGAAQYIEEMNFYKK